MEFGLKTVLADIVRQTAPLFEKIRVTGLDTGIKVEAHTEDKMLFLVGELQDTVPELAGEFGICDLSLLHRLFNFASYNADNATFTVHRTDRDGLSYVSEFEFSDTQGGGTRFRTMNPRLVSDQAKIANIPWSVTVTPSKSKTAELIQLAGLLSDVEKHFSVHVKNNTLFLTLGGKGAASHMASVAFATDVEVGADLPSANMFKTAQFLNVLKVAGNLPVLVRFSARHIAGITITTEKGVYNYLLRATEG
jgi:hypothetical protein